MQWLPVTKERSWISSGSSGSYPNTFEVMNIHHRSFDENHLSEETLEECLQLQVRPLAERKKSEHDPFRRRRRYRKSGKWRRRRRKKAEEEEEEEE